VIEQVSRVLSDHWQRQDTDSEKSAPG